MASRVRNRTVSTAVTTSSRPRTVEVLQADDEQHHQREPDQVDRPGALAGQHGVDQQLEQREHGAEHGEQPELVLDLGVLRTADEDQGQLRQQRAREDTRGAQHQDQRQAADQGLAAFVSRRHRRERHHHHELRQEQHRLGEDQAAGVETGVVPVEDVAGDDHVGVDQAQERQQGLGVAEDLAHDRAGRVVLADAAGGPLASQGVDAQHHRDDRAQEDAEHRAELGRPPEDQGGADDQAGDAAGHVDHRDRPPAAFALEDAELTSRDRERDGGERDERRRGHVVEPEQPVDDRGQQQQAYADEGSRAVGQGEDLALDLGDVTRIGRDPAGGGGLDAELHHRDDEQHRHQRGEGAVVLRAEQPGGQRGEDVRREVHHRHRHGDAGAAVADARRALGGRHRASLRRESPAIVTGSLHSCR